MSSKTTGKAETGRGIRDGYQRQLEHEGGRRREVWRLLSQLQMNRLEEKVPDTLDGARANASPLASSQLYTSESKKTSQVDMRDLTPPAPAAGVTCALRVSLKALTSSVEKTQHPT